MAGSGGDGAQNDDNTVKSTSSAQWECWARQKVVVRKRIKPWRKRGLGSLAEEYVESARNNHILKGTSSLLEYFQADMNIKGGREEWEKRSDMRDDGRTLEPTLVGGRLASEAAVAECSVPSQSVSGRVRSTSSQWKRCREKRIVRERWRGLAAVHCLQSTGADHSTGSQWNSTNNNKMMKKCTKGRSETGRSFRGEHSRHACPKQSHSSTKLLTLPRLGC